MASRNGPTSATPLLHAQINSASAGRGVSPDPRGRGAILPQSSSSHSPSGRSEPARLRRRRHRPSSGQSLRGLILLAALAGFAFVAWDVSSLGGCYVRPICRALGVKGRGAEDEWLRGAGVYAPWRAWDTSGGSKNLPRGCEVDQVNILHRHTARYPTSEPTRKMRRVLEKLIIQEEEELAFVSGADLDLEDWIPEALTDQGRKEWVCTYNTAHAVVRLIAWRSGRDAGAMYRTLAQQSDVFSRSSGVDRVVETGQYWLEGFREEPFKLKRRTDLPCIDVVIPSSDTSNNTLSVNTCPAFTNNSSTTAADALPQLLQPALDRLNTLLQPQPALTMDDLSLLGDMCPFDSQAQGEDWEGWSKWCGIFSRREWEVLGYIRAVTRYYTVGQGSHFGRTLGAGWVNELIARLTDSEPQDSTSTNRTLDADEATFPRGGKRIFVVCHFTPRRKYLLIGQDFSHDNEMLEIITALNIFPLHRPLPTDSVPQKRSYPLSRLVPFGSRLVVERIACDLNEWEPDPNAGEGGSDPSRGEDDKRDYVRIMLNGKVLQVEHVACQQSGFFEHGMCDVESFIDSQVWSTDQVDWSICYE